MGGGSRVTFPAETNSGACSGAVRERTGGSSVLALRGRRKGEGGRVGWQAAWSWKDPCRLWISGAGQGTECLGFTVGKLKPGKGRGWAEGGSGGEEADPQRQQAGVTPARCLLEGGGKPGSSSSGPQRAHGDERAQVSVWPRAQGKEQVKAEVAASAVAVTAAGDQRPGPSEVGVLRRWGAEATTAAEGWNLGLEQGSR